jgi:hypothetical protein
MLELHASSITSRSASATGSPSSASTAGENGPVAPLGWKRRGTATSAARARVPASNWPSPIAKGVLPGLFDQRGRDGEQRREPVVVDVQRGEERRLLDRARLDPGGLERLPVRPRRDRVGARDAAGEVDGHPIGRRQRRGEILLEAIDAGYAVSLGTQQRAPRRVAEAAGVVLADHQADDLGQIDVDVHQEIALDVEADLRPDDPRTAAVEGDRVHHKAVLLTHRRLRVGIAARLDQWRLPLDLV